MSVRSAVRACVPPALLQAYRHWSGTDLRFAGRPASWDDALKASQGYDSASILDRVVDATRAVVSGRARHERDSVLFDDLEPPFAVLSTLWRAMALEHSRTLDVVDVGGALGSTYRECRPLLSATMELRWHIVEQPHFVAAGAEFASRELRFFESPSSVPPPVGAQVLVLSSVLQYLQHPLDVLDGLAALPARHLVVDRTPMSDASHDRLCIQRVPSHIYAASYPCRLLSRQRLLGHLRRQWRLVADFPCAEGKRVTNDGENFEYRGMVLERTLSTDRP